LSHPSSNPSLTSTNLSLPQANTVEDRILTLQATKAELAKAALDGGDMGKANKLSMADVLYLFRGEAAPVKKGRNRLDDDA
jgi:hypothetical protein